MTLIVLSNKENENTECVYNPNGFGYITLDRKLGKLKNTSRGSSYCVSCKKEMFITWGGQAILQLLWRSCPLWYALWLFSSILEVNYIVMQKENGLIPIWLVSFCILWMYCRLQTAYSIIALLLFFFRISHWTFSVSSNVK